MDTDQMEILVENVNQIIAALEASDIAGAAMWAEHMRSELTSRMAVAKEPV